MPRPCTKSCLDFRTRVSGAEGFRATPLLSRRRSLLGRAVIQLEHATPLTALRRRVPPAIFIAGKHASLCCVSAIHDCTNATSLHQRGVGLAANCDRAPLLPHAMLPYEGCYRTDRVSRLADGTLVLSRGALLARVPRSFPIESSPEGRAHFSIFESGWGARSSLWVPPSRVVRCSL